MARLAVSEWTLGRARNLGDEMARDPLIRPHVVEVLQYENYYRFRLSHRAYWEQSSRWEKHYQDRIFAIADKECAKYHWNNYDNIGNWDVWYNRLVQPIKNSLWETWEEAFKLEARYFEALLSTGRANPRQVLSIIGASPTDDSMMDEEVMPIIPIPPEHHRPMGTLPTMMRFLGLQKRPA